MTDITCIRLRNLREDNNLTQAQVAEILVCHKDVYRRYEVGIHPTPLDMLKRLCIFYNVSADYLLGLSDKKNPSDWLQIVLRGISGIAYPF